MSLNCRRKMVGSRSFNSSGMPLPAFRSPASALTSALTLLSSLLDICPRTVLQRILTGLTQLMSVQVHKGLSIRLSSREEHLWRTGISWEIEGCSIPLPLPCSEMEIATFVMALPTSACHRSPRRHYTPFRTPKWHE